MRYVSIDTETTGLDKERCQLLSIGAVIEDTENPLPLEEMPQFHCIIVHDFIEGQPFALNMNKEIIEILGRYAVASYQQKALIAQEVLDEKGIYLLHMHEVANKFLDFIDDNNMPRKFVVAGKNYNAFDRIFLSNVPNWDSHFPIHRRVLDPATSLTKTTDEVPPNLEECLKRCGIIKGIAHDAVEDAFDVVQVLRHVIK